MRRFLLTILPYPLFVLLAVLLIVEQNREPAISANEHLLPDGMVVDTESATGKTASKDKQQNSNDKHLVGSKQSVPEVLDSSVSLARLESAVKEADRQTLQQLSTQLPQQYADDFAVLVRVHLKLAEAWNQLEDFSKMQTELKSAKTALDEIRCQYMVMKMKHLSILAGAESLLGNSENAKKIKHEMTRLPIERKPFTETHHRRKMCQYHEETAIQLTYGTPVDEWHKIYADPNRVLHHFRDADRAKYHLRVFKELNRPDSAYNIEGEQFIRRFIAVLKGIIKDYEPESGLPKHAKAILKYLKEN